MADRFSLRRGGLPGFAIITGNSNSGTTAGNGPQCHKRERAREPMAPQTLVDLFEEAVTHKSRPDALLVKRDGDFKPLSSAEVRSQVQGLVAGLVNLGAEPGDRRTGPNGWFRTSPSFPPAPSTFPSIRRCPRTRSRVSSTTPASRSSSCPPRSNWRRFGKSRRRFPASRPR